MRRRLAQESLSTRVESDEPRVPARVLAAALAADQHDFLTPRSLAWLLGARLTQAEATLRGLANLGLATPTPRRSTQTLYRLTERGRTLCSIVVQNRALI